MDENDILVVRCTSPLSRSSIDYLRDYIIGQRECGVIVLPNICEAIVVPKDITIEVQGQENN